MKQRGEIKIYFFMGFKHCLELMQALFEFTIIYIYFFPLLCTTSPVAVFRFWVTSSICLKSKPPGLLFFFCFYTECQAFAGLWMTCAPCLGVVWITGLTNLPRVRIPVPRTFGAPRRCSVGEIESRCAGTA